MKPLKIRFPESIASSIQAGAETFENVSASEVARAAMQLGLEQLFEMNRTQRSTATGAIIKNINSTIKAKDKE